MVSKSYRQRSSSKKSNASIASTSRNSCLVAAMNTRFSVSTLLALFACGLLTLASGCQSTSKKLAAMNPMSSWNEEEVEIGVPDRVVSTWTEAVLHQEGQSTRGFGGRLFFYGRKSDKPIRVAGQLVVYAFAEDGREQTNNCPTKRYVFPPQQLAKHESQGEEASEIGVSYSIWLPWDAAGGPQSDISLIARFEPLQGGGLIVSEQARQRLPGAPRQETMLAKEPEKSTIERTSFNTTAESNQATTANFEQPIPEAENKLGVTATTISLPGRYAAPSSIGTGAKSQLPGKARTRTLPATTSKTPVTLPEVNKPATTVPASAAIVPPGMMTENRMPSVAAQSSAPTMGSALQTGGEQLTGEPAAFQPTPMGTSVKMLTPGDSVRQSLQPRSFGSSQ
jgi:hypothetical protein